MNDTPERDVVEGLSQCARDGSLHKDARQCCRRAASTITSLRAQLREVDELLDIYGIDTVGTGSGPTKKEQRRVDAILERSAARVAIRARAQQQIGAER